MRDQERKDMAKTCVSCGKSYLGGTLCTPCRQKALHMGNQARKSKVLSKLRDKCGIVAVKWLSNHDKAALLCQGCGHSWNCTPNAALKLGKCPKCKSKVKAVPVVTWHRNTDKVGGTKCPILRVPASYVKGMDWMLEAKNIPARSIFTTKPEQATTFRLGGERVKHLPALKVKSTLVDLVNVRDLFSKWKYHAAVAKAYERNKIEYRILLERKTGFSFLRLGWHKTSPMAVANYLALKDTVAAHGDTVRVLSMDPGVKNFAWAVVEVNPDKQDVIASGLIEHTLTGLSGTDFSIKLEEFKEEVDSICSEYNVSAMLAVERFVSRGLKGSTGELISISVGVLVEMFSRKRGRFELIMASQWKNEFNRVRKLEKLYSTVKCVNHQVDAILIGMYCAARWFGQRPYTALSSSIEYKKLVKRINATNLLV